MRATISQDIAHVHNETTAAIKIRFPMLAVRLVYRLKSIPGRWRAACLATCRGNVPTISTPFSLYGNAIFSHVCRGFSVPSCLATMLAARFSPHRHLHCDLDTSRTGQRTKRSSLQKTAREKVAVARFHLSANDIA
jgi:hypothetical protein